MNLKNAGDWPVVGNKGVASRLTSTIFAIMLQPSDRTRRRLRLTVCDVQTTLRQHLLKRFPRTPSGGINSKLKFNFC